MGSPKTFWVKLGFNLNYQSIVAHLPNWTWPNCHAVPVLMARWALKFDTVSNNGFGLSPLKDKLKKSVMLCARATVEQQKRWFIPTRRWVKKYAMQFA